MEVPEIRIEKAVAEDERSTYDLKKVFLDKEGRLVATDGHVCIVAETTLNGTDKSGGISPEILTTARADGGKIDMSTPETVKMPTIDSIFKKMSNTGVPLVIVNVEVLRKALDSLEGNNPRFYLALYPGKDSQHSALMLARTDGKAIGFVMPINPEDFLHLTAEKMIAKFSAKK